MPSRALALHSGSAFFTDSGLEVACRRFVQDDGKVDSAPAGRDVFQQAVGQDRKTAQEWRKAKIIAQVGIAPQCQDPEAGGAGKIPYPRRRVETIVSGESVIFR